jgi:hypothetical protein
MFKTGKIWKIPALVFGIFVIIAMIGGNNSTSNTPTKIESNPTSSKEEIKEEEPKQSEVPKQEEKDKQSFAIPGLSPSDVYLNFENRGFKTERVFGEDYNWWDSRLSEAGIDYRVSTYAVDRDVTTVKTVYINAMLNGKEKKDIVAVLPFIKFGATVPYQNADPEKAVKWVEENFNKDKATTEINGVRFTISAPTKFSRTLRMEKI